MVCQPRSMSIAGFRRNAVRIVLGTLGSRERLCLRKAGGLHTGGSLRVVVEIFLGAVGVSLPVDG